MSNNLKEKQLMEKKEYSKPAVSSLEMQSLMDEGFDVNPASKRDYEVDSKEDSLGNDDEDVGSTIWED